MRISSDRLVDQVALGPRWAGTDLEHLPTGIGHDEPGYLPVYIYEILDADAVSRALVGQSALRPKWYGEVARRPDLLPATQEEKFERDYQLLEKFAAREGHSDVPLNHREEGVNLGVWVSNLRFEHANLGLRRDWSSQLEQLPGWRWLPGSDFYLLERYARREETTRIPPDHVEEGRPLGSWVADLRRLHEDGRLARDWETRLEAIPFWEW